MPDRKLTSDEEEARRIAEMGKPVLGEHSKLEVIIEESYEFKVGKVTLQTEQTQPDYYSSNQSFPCSQADILTTSAATLPKRTAISNFSSSGGDMIHTYPLPSSTRNTPNIFVSGVWFSSEVSAGT